jgi:hypothetical protein
MTRRLYRPRPVTVQADAAGVPAAIGRAQVDAIREEWLIDDRWWTGRPLQRRYFDLVTADGVNRVVYRDLASGRWFGQRGA